MPSFLISYFNTETYEETGLYNAIQKVQNLTELVIALWKNAEFYEKAKVSLLLENGQITLGVVDLQTFNDTVIEDVRDNADLLF